MLTLTLPFPPSANNLHFVAGRRKVLSKRGRQYYADVAALVMETGYPKAPPGRLAVVVEVHPSSRRRLDIMNFEKALFDSLKHAGVIEDDSLIDDCRFLRRGVVKGGKMVVTFSAFQGE